MFFMALIIMVTLAAVALAVYAFWDTIWRDGRVTGKVLVGISGLYAVTAVTMLLVSLVNR